MAPPAPRVIWKGAYGVSVWVEVLTGKYWFGFPLNRMTRKFSSLGLNLASGSIVGGFKQLEKFLRPVYDLIVEQNIKGFLL